MTRLCISDNAQDQLVIVETDSMSIETKVPTGKSPYPVDQISKDTVFVSTRGEQSILPVNFISGSAGKAILLPHHPRSTTNHKKKNIALVGGVETSQTSLIDTATNSVIFSVGKADFDTRRDFGGGLACGHPSWVSEEEFLHLDRVERRLELFSLESHELLSWCNLPTSPHHVAKSGNDFYVMCEGNRNSLISPSVAKFQIINGSISIAYHQFLPVSAMSIRTSGGHHLTVDVPNGRIYVGTADSRLFTLDSSDLSVLNVIDAGTGCGHVTLCPEIGLGVTTNHTDTFMTVFELSTGRACSKIEVSSPQANNKKTQGHTSKWFASESRIYTSAAQDGKILEIDPSSQTITRSLDIPGAYLLQGTFIK